MQARLSSFAVVGFVFALVLGLLALPAASQNYTFTSGPGGDGFSWPASPTGMLDGNGFSTPDGVSIHNATGNSVFFDQQYQVVGNGSRITGDALWGNPTDQGFSPTLDFDFYGLGGIQELDFDFAWSQAGVPAVSDFLQFVVEDSDGRFTFGDWSLNDQFTGFGGGTGYEDHISLDASMFVGEDLGEDFVDIAYLTIFLDEIVTGGPSSEFAIDNFALDGSGPGGGGPNEVYPSVNGGQFDVTGNTNGTSALRGTGTAGIGLEVTNDSGSATTYSIQLQAGGGLSAGTIVSGDPILDGQSLFTSNIGTVDRSLPAGDYTSQVVTINNGDPLDPDNTSSLSIDLLDAPLLSGTAGTVDVSAGQNATLSNAAGPFRASVKFDAGTTTTTGPFTLVSDFDDVRVLPGGSASASLGFDRFGQLSGTRTGTLTTSGTTAHYIINGQVDFEASLQFAEAIPDQTWNLSYNHVNTTTDNGGFTAGFTLKERIGVNTFDVAATLIDGTSGSGQSISLQITADPDPASADLIGDAVDLVFGGGGGEPYVLQLAYNDAALPGGAAEGDLKLLWYDATAGDWAQATDGNTAGSATFFAGSYADYLAGPGGGTFNAGDLGAYGLDTVNNHVWAALNHASLFGVGVLSTGGITGDYNGSGQVEQGDLDLVLQNWGDDTAVTGIPAGWINDNAGIGQIEQTELDKVLQNWGSTSAPDFQGSSVPEPGTLALLGLSAVALRRRRA